MSFGGFVRQVLDALEAAHVTYLIGGAVALAAWGETRTTRDLDLVVQLPFESMLALSRELAQRDMLVPVENMIDLMIEDRADLPISAIHMVSGYKAELYLLKPADSFRESCLQRRRLVDLGPPLGKVYVHSPEDLILNKLRYFQLSQQPKHVRDIAGIVLNLEPELDHLYLEHWLQAMGLIDAWRNVQESIARLRDKHL